VGFLKEFVATVTSTHTAIAIVACFAIPVSSGLALVGSDSSLPVTGETDLVVSSAVQFFILPFSNRLLARQTAVRRQFVPANGALRYESLRETFHTEPHLATVVRACRRPMVACDAGVSRCRHFEKFFVLVAVKVDTVC
jgi:hypothetical protein